MLDRDVHWPATNGEEQKQEKEDERNWSAVCVLP